MNHFDEMSCLLYLEGQLDADRAREVAEHAATCAGCRELLHALETEDRWLREALGAEDESVPARLMEAPERGGAPWGWITALTLAAGGAYTVWSGFVEPWRAQADQAGFTQGNFLTMLFFSGTFWKGWDAMRSLMEFMAVATLGIVVTWLLRRHWKRLTTIAVVMGSVLCALGLAPSASAADVKHGDPNYTLPAGQEVKTDLIVWADTTRIDGDVDGDLIVWSRNVIVNGHVKGDVLCWAQMLRMNGTVDGNVRTLAQSASISGMVTKNLMMWAGQADVENKGAVGGTVTIGAGDSVLDGKIVGDVLGFGGNYEVNGTLGHNMMVHSDRLTLGSTAEIKGSAKYEGNHEAEVDPGAKLGSPLDFVHNQHGPDYTRARYYFHQTLLWGASFIFGLAVLFLAPGFFFDATGCVQESGTVDRIWSAVSVCDADCGDIDLLHDCGNCGGSFDRAAVCGGGLLDAGFCRRMAGRKNPGSKHRDCTGRGQACAGAGDLACIADGALRQRIGAAACSDLGHGRFGAGILQADPASTGACYGVGIDCGGVFLDPAVPFQQTSNARLAKTK